MKTPYQDLVGSFDIRRGDILLVVSDVLALAKQSLEAKETFDAGLFLESIEKKIGEGGTLLFPTFHFGFCSGALYDILKTPPVTGALGRCALKRAGYTRTRHPIHSFAVWGAKRRELMASQNKSSYGPDSPFGFLHRNKGKMWIVGRSYGNSFTFVHYVVESEHAPYRYAKNFRALYKDEMGLTTVREYGMYVRDLKKGVESDVEPIGRELEKAGAAESKTIDGIPYRLVRLDEAYPVIARDILENGGKKLHKEVTRGTGSKA